MGVVEPRVKPLTSMQAGSEGESWEQERWAWEVEVSLMTDSEDLAELQAGVSKQPINQSNSAQGTPELHVKIQGGQSPGHSQGPWTPQHLKLPETPTSFHLCLSSMPRS